MSIQMMNEALAASQEPVMICPWNDAWSNQCQVAVKEVAENRMVTYTWEGGEGLVEKTSQVCFSTWRFIVENLSK